MRLRYYLYKLDFPIFSKLDFEPRLFQMAQVRNKRVGMINRMGKLSNTLLEINSLESYIITYRLLIPDPSNRGQSISFDCKTRPF